MQEVHRTVAECGDGALNLVVARAREYDKGNSSRSPSVFRILFEWSKIKTFVINILFSLDFLFTFVAKLVKIFRRVKLL